MGKVFFDELENIKIREQYSKEQWKDFQTQQLRKLLVHAFLNVPFYNEKYSSKGFKVEDFQKFQIEDLHQLPYLTKEDFRRFGKTKLLSNIKHKGNFYESSGSTGTPVSVYMSKNFHQLWSAYYEQRVRQWAGVNHTMRRGMIGGRRVLPQGKVDAPYYRYNQAEKQVYFSAYHLSPKTVHNYVEGINKYKLDYLVGYANSLYFWADFIIKQHITVPPLKAVLTSSETLTDAMRQTIEKAFGCKVYDAYSGVEACGLISENPYGELMFSPDTGIMEIINDKGEYVKNAETGELVLTGLHNYDQPLIRYKIGDRLTLSQNQQSKSHMKMPIISHIEGRVEDVVYGSDGRKMVRFHGLFININGLEKAQIIQKTLQDFTLKLIVDATYQKTSEEIILKRLQSQLGNVKVQFDYVNHILMDENGKYKAVISHVNN